MRLVCPNCDAQYEVPDDVMPVAGRDVQCSNCGQTWFQNHPDHVPEDDGADLDVPALDEEVAPPPPPPPPPHATPAEPERKQLDPAVADILRQEAEAEQAARHATQSTGLESQPDLGMDFSPENDADRRAREARDRMARLRGNDTPEVQAAGGTGAVDKAAAAPLGSRRDLLPNIDEINSTLRSGSARTGTGAVDIEPEVEAPTLKRKRRGFRTGFLTVMLIFIVLATVYILAPRLASAVPALESPLQKYVMTIDQGRVWLDGKVQGLLKSLDSAAEDSQ